MRELISLVILSTLCHVSNGFSFSIASPTTKKGVANLQMSNDNDDKDSNASYEEGRRGFMSSVVTSSAVIWSINSSGAVAEESIAERAARISREMGEDEKKMAMMNKNKNSKIAPPVDADKVIISTDDKKKDSRTMYDFSVPIAGKDTKISDVVGPNAKAVLVVNIKQDDPYARKNIPSMLSLASKYGPKGLVVIAVPTDQGYYEPDTSVLIRLKLNSEYGYGINPAAVLTDKMNLLGTASHPFMRWLQGSCRTPQGLGKIQANFEKFLLDAETGLPLRRYPRKYLPYEMIEDIEALVVNGEHVLPPSSVFYREEWRNAIKEADADTYRFQKGLNVFDQ